MPSPHYASELPQIRSQAGLTQALFAEKLGISRSHLAKLESEPAKRLSSKLSRALNSIQRPPSTPPRLVPIKSWAQAGEGGDYEELPIDWQRMQATDCPNPDAFALEVRGDSMEPKYCQGDVLVLMPSETPRSGSLVVARTREGDVLFKIYTPSAPSIGEVTLTSLNPAYAPIVVPQEELLWIYPVYQTIRNLWNGTRR